jgi:hypothetical protein
MFSHLDEIRKAHGVTDTKWALEAGLRYPARISEIRRLVREQSQRTGTQVANSNQFPERATAHRRGVGRAFTWAKCMALLNGLRRIIGGEIVTRELLKLIERAKTIREQNLLMLLALPEEDELQQQVALFLKATLRASVRKIDAVCQDVAAFGPG